MRERDVRFLDARIGLLIQNRMALDEVMIYFTKVEIIAVDPFYILTLSNMKWHHA